MTVFQLKQQIDRRFDEQRVRLDAGFTSLHDKLNAILRTLKSKDDNQQEVLDEHEERLRDLATWRRSTRDI